MKRVLLTAFLIVGACKSSARAPQPGSVTGAVAISDGHPATNCLIKIEGSPLSTRCDIEGKFTLNRIPPGNWNALVSPDPKDSVIAPQKKFAVGVNTGQISNLGTLTLGLPPGEIGGHLNGTIETGVLYAAYVEPGQLVGVDVDGYYLIPSLVPGTKTVSMFTPQGTIVTDNIKVESGKITTVDFDLSEAQTITASVAGTALRDWTTTGDWGGLQIELLNPYSGENEATATSSAAGAFSFSGITGAPYVIKASDPAHDRTRAAFRLIAVTQNLTLDTPLIVTQDDGTPDPCTDDTNGNGIPDCVDPNPNGNGSGPVVIGTPDGQHISCTSDADCASTCGFTETAICDANHICQCDIVLSCMTGLSSCGEDCVDEGSDKQNCGGCGVLYACSNNNITAHCSEGDCDGTCATNWGDCDGNKRYNGCETNIGRDLLNCGGCGAVCSSNNLLPVCTDGVCGGSCLYGFSDCNSDKLSDGCEVSILTDTNNCGGCGNICSGTHVTPTCMNGICGGSCEPGYENCSGNTLEDGCDTQTGGSDVDHCGGCTSVCSTMNITRSCSAGVCNGTCAATYADCDNNKLTNGCEVKITTDANNCGACGTVCSSNHINPTCSNGACTGLCNIQYADCNNDKQSDGCETPIYTSAMNCGGCGNVCSTNHILGAACSNAQCNGFCAFGYADCNSNKMTDGCETDTSTSVTNCGGCEQICSTNNITRDCTNGSCEGGVCNSGYADCNATKQVDGCEINTNTDPDNCGGCGNSCSSSNLTRSCAAGVCNGTCYSAYLDCNNNKLTDGCEVSKNIDVDNCGSCGNSCPTVSNATRTCVSGTCGFTCNTGYLTCGSGCCSVTAIAGSQHATTCALTSAGGVKCWGYNGTGQFGNNSTTNVPVPVDSALTSGVSAISVGYQSMCALTSGGGVKCWGDNTSGQLGNNSNANTSWLPVDVTGLTSGVSAISAGGSFACALISGGVKCWGKNANGQLGNNSIVNSNVPVQVLGLTSNVTAISAGYTSACAVVAGAVKCWGQNNYGQLGNNSTTDSTIPVTTANLTNVNAVSVGGQVACAIDGGALKCWGDNSQGELGDNSTTNSLIPVSVSGMGSSIFAIAAGYQSVCAIVASGGGGAKCWGFGNQGELGNNTASSSLVPVAVTGLTTGITKLTLGSSWGCAVKDGVPLCWGYNYFAQLGNNSNAQSNAPINVLPGH